MLFSVPSLMAGISVQQDEYSYSIGKTEETIRIDGELNEAVWHETPVISDFWMSYPVDDRKAGRCTNGISYHRADRQKGGPGTGKDT